MTNEEMRSASGEVRSSDPVVALLYTLLRDQIQPGLLEEIVMNMEACENKTEYLFSNGWLANYAKCIRSRLAEMEAQEDAETESQINESESDRLQPRDADDGSAIPE